MECGMNVNVTHSGCSTTKGLVYRIAGNFCMVQIFLFSRHAGEHKNKTAKNFHIRKYELKTDIHASSC